MHISNILCEPLKNFLPAYTIVGKGNVILNFATSRKLHISDWCNIELFHICISTIIPSNSIMAWEVSVPEKLKNNKTNREKQVDLAQIFF